MTASMFSQVNLQTIAGAQGFASMLIEAGQGPCLIINRSAIYNVWLGSDTSIQPGDPGSTSPLSPGASAVFSGTTDVYGVVDFGGNATVNIYPTGTYITPQISDVILTSIPNSSPGAGTPITPGGSFTSPIFSVASFNSYDFSANIYTGSQATAGAALVSQITLTWFEDSGGNFPVYSEVWWTWNGNAVNFGMPFYGSGSMHGSYFQVKITNNGSASSMFIQQLTLIGSARNSNGSSWRQATPLGINSGITLWQSGALGSNGLENIIANFDGSTVPISSTVWQPFPLCAGAIWAYFSTSAALNKNAVLCNAAGINNGLIQAGTNCPGTMWNPQTQGGVGAQAAGANYTANLIAPRAPLFIVMQTTGTAASNINLALNGQQGSY